MKNQKIYSLKNNYIYFDCLRKIRELIDRENKQLEKNNVPKLKYPNISSEATESLATFLIKDKLILHEMFSEKIFSIKRKSQYGKDVVINDDIVVEIKATSSDKGFTSCRGSNLESNYLIWLNFYPFYYLKKNELHIYIFKNPKKCIESKILLFKGNCERKINFKTLADEMLKRGDKNILFKKYDFENLREINNTNRFF